MKGILAVNKPKGITSHDVVNRIRKVTGVKRVGHGGTLDPLASGVLVIAIGRENTKKLDQYVKGEKEYVATLKLGFESETDDAEGPIRRFDSQGKAKTPNIDDIQDVLKKFQGKIEQTPPRYSAIKIEGKAAYKYARKNQEIELKERIVEIKEIELIDYSFPFLKLRIVTGPGTYIRSLARDIGKKLKTGAYLSDLVRTRVASFTLETARPIEEFSI